MTKKSNRGRRKGDKPKPTHITIDGEKVKVYPASYIRQVTGLKRHEFDRLVKKHNMERHVVARVPGPTTPYFYKESDYLIFKSYVRPKVEKVK